MPGWQIALIAIGAALLAATVALLFNRGTVRANQLTFEYLTQGDGPLALVTNAH